MIPKKTFNQIEQNITSIINKDSALAIELWNELLKIHPADLAFFFANIEREDFKALFQELPDKLKTSVFEYLSDSMKVYCLSFLNDEQRILLLEKTPVEKITDLFDYLSDDEIKHYFELMRKNDRESVISLMKFNPESIGGIMDPYVVSLKEDFSVEQSIHICQRIKPNKELHQQIYVTDKANKLMGHIMLEDLVLKHPKQKLSSILRENTVVAHVEEDREEVAKKMLRYNLTIAPVVGDGEFFLGVIPSETLIDIIEEEASEDVYKISAMTPIKRSYFDTSFFRLCYERSYILIALLLVGSFSSTILKAYDAILTEFYFLGLFIPMLVSAGGNTSSQTSAITIQGLASGEVNYSNVHKFFKREFLMALVLAIILGITAFGRVYFTHGNVLNSFVVSFSLSIIVLVSVSLGSFIPLLLKRFNIDPAFTAGPFLATLMDILGILIYCYISKLILT